MPFLCTRKVLTPLTLGDFAAQCSVSLLNATSKRPYGDGGTTTLQENLPPEGDGQPVGCSMDVAVDEGGDIAASALIAR